MRIPRPALSAIRSSSFPILVAMAVTTSPPRLAAQGFVLRGGLNLSKFVGADAAQSDAKRGLNLGGSLRLVGFGPFSVWAEGYYRQKGADNLQTLSEGGTTTVPDKVQVGIDYVEIPVLLRVDIPVPWLKVRPYLQGGPAFGWKLDCSVSYSTLSGATTPDCDQLLGGNATTTLRNYEQGVAFGGGLDLHILGDIGALNLDARVTRGLSRLAQSSGGPDVKNQSVTLMLGYSLHVPGMGGPPGGGRF